MIMLERYGMHSVIADPLDDTLIDIAKGNRQDIVDVVHAVMDGNEPDMGGLSKELQDSVKTANVILGKTLYSDSWLEI
jgi:5-methyltetrahydrofolate corrinoid/iron sulfur protein methyltransferase